MKPNPDEAWGSRATLPVFALSTDPPTLETVRALTAPIRDTHGTPDVDASTGSIWIASDALWRLPAITSAAIDALPATRPSSRSDRLAAMVAAVEQRTDGVRVRADPAWSDGARLVIWERERWARTSRFLDRTDRYTVRLDAPDHDLDAVPITGPGAVVTTRTGPRGEALGFHAAIPRLSGARFELPMVDRATADGHIRESLSGFDRVLLDATLTYRVAETADGRYLCPYWAYEIVVRQENRFVPVASRCIPAVEIERLSRVPVAESPVSRHDDHHVDWGPPDPAPRFLLSWLGEETGRLTQSRAVRDALVTTLVRSGWQCRDFGEHAAVEAHWNRLAASAIRQADLAGYVGHAAEYGLKFSPPDAAWLEAHVCRFGDRLKWVVIDGCGPLQDEVAASGTSAFDMWARAFHGIRALLGFATTQEQNAHQFPRAIEYSLEGQPLARAWFRAACECQGSRANHGSPAWAAGLFCVDGSSTTIEDRLTDVQRLPALHEPERLAGVWVPLG